MATELKELLEEKKAYLKSLEVIYYKGIEEGKTAEAFQPFFIEIINTKEKIKTIEDALN